MKNIILSVKIILICFISTGCKTTIPIEKNEILSENKLTELKKILTENTTVTLKDTIIINYNYNTNKCWMILDEKDDSYFKKVLNEKYSLINNFKKNREHISFFMFREVGNSFNDIIKKNKIIQVDEHHKLYHLLFDKPSICGNSIMILPDGKYIYKENDSHLDILQISKKDISDKIK